MNGDLSGDPRVRARRSVRQSLLAVFVSALFVGGIVAFSGSDDGRSVALAPSPTPTAVRAPIAPADAVVTPVDRAPLSSGTPAAGSPAGNSGLTDTSLVEATTASATPASTTAAATTGSTAASTTAGSTTGSATAGTTAPAVAQAVAIPVGGGVPTVNAKAFAVYDSTKGTWLAGSQADAPLPVGSIMKLVTSYVVLHAGDLAKVVTVPKLQVDPAESAIGLYKGEQLTRDILFRAMLIVSANDAARTLAIDIGGTTDGFVTMMNEAAAKLGLTNTVAANPIGLDADGAHSSARDVIDIATLLMQDATFREAVAKPVARLHGQTYSSTNKLLTTYPGADGIKTGHTTDAGYCLVASATRNGRRIIVSVLGAATENERFADAAALLDWAFAQP